jgi:hypothetical protein
MTKLAHERRGRAPQIVQNEPGDVRIMRVTKNFQSCEGNLLGIN